MANLVIPANQIQPNLVNPDGRPRNGVPVEFTVFRDIADAQRHCAGYKRRMLAWHACDITNMPTANGDRGFLSFRTGQNVTAVTVYAVLGQTNGGSGVPGIQLEYVSGTGGTDSRVFSGTRAAAAEVNPDGYLAARANITGLTANSEYTYKITATNSCRMVGLTVWERESHSADPTVTGIPDSDYARGENMTDRHFTDITDEAWMLWQHNAGYLYYWTGPTSGQDIAITSVSAVNIWDETATTVTASTLGCRFQTRYRGTQENTDVPVRLGVYGRYTDQVSGVDGTFTAKDSSGDLGSVTFTGGTNTWQYVNFNLTAQDLHKVDFHGEVDTDGTMTIDAIVLYQYET